MLRELVRALDEEKKEVKVQNACLGIGIYDTRFVSTRSILSLDSTLPSERCINLSHFELFRVFGVAPLMADCCDDTKKMDLSAFDSRSMSTS